MRMVLNKKINEAAKAASSDGLTAARYLERYILPNFIPASRRHASNKVSIES